MLNIFTILILIFQGRDATFTCVVNNLGGYRVSGESTGGAQARVRTSLSMHVLNVAQNEIQSLHSFD